MNWLAIDIGGANIKLATGTGYAESRPFPLWQQPDMLSHELRTRIAEAPPCDHLIITMTGELADCFASKAEGVKFILKAVESASDRRHTRVYLTTGVMVTVHVATSKWAQAAASNWHALATFCGRLAPKGPALVVDIGSTTTDVIPLLDGKVVARGTNDTERLIEGELAYTGVERSPLCAVIAEAPYRDRVCPVAQEFFATTRDVYLVLGNLAEDANDAVTADRRPATKQAARLRLARSVCGDDDNFNHRDAVAIAVAAAEKQAQFVSRAIAKVAARLPTPPATVVLSGHGEFLARKALEQLPISPKLVSLAQELGPSISRVGPAHALAVLAREAAGA